MSPLCVCVAGGGGGGATVVAHKHKFFLPLKVLVGRISQLVRAIRRVFPSSFPDPLPDLVT